MRQILFKRITTPRYKILRYLLILVCIFTISSVGSLSMLMMQQDGSGLQIFNPFENAGHSSIITETDGDIHVVWHDNITGTYQLYYNRLSGNQFQIWETAQQITESAGDAMYPSITLDKHGYIHVVWQDNRSGHWDIYYIKLDNTGYALISEERVTDDPGDSIKPEITIDKYNNVQITWYDNRNGDYDIFWDKRVEPELSLVNMTISPEKPIEDESTDIEVTLQNTGNNSALNVSVEFLVDSNVQESTSIDIDAQSQQPLLFTWNAIYGTHELMIQVDPENHVAENDENNNIDAIYARVYRISEFNNPGIWANATVKHCVDVDVAIEEVDDPDASGTPNNIGKFVNFTVDTYFDNAMIQIGYDEEELQGMGITEETLLMYYWDPYDSEGDRWVGIEDSGVNVEDDYVWANVSHFSIFAPLVPEGFVLNLEDFPMYSAESPFNEMCGPATAKMTLDYIWWNSSQNPEGPPDLYNQSDLYQAGLENNTNQSLPYLDTQGLWYIIQYNKPMPYSEYGYNFMKYKNEDLDEMLKRICLWINYTVGTVGGYKPEHPLHVPAVVPAYGGYTNWMAIRGFHANRTAHPMPNNITVYGFWVNDPYPSSLGGLGENSYKMLATWVSDYYQPLVTDDTYNGKYVAIFEPPEINNEVEFNIARSPIRFSLIKQQIIKLVQLSKDTISKELIKQTDQWIIQAAVDGVSEQLIPYDDDFAAVFEKTIPGKPIFVENLVGNNYYAVPFNLRGQKAVVVILIDADDGSFKEASWTRTPVAYLPLSKEEAQLIAFEFAVEELGLEISDINELQPELIHRKSTPYYPEWQILIENYGIYVSQDGTVTYIIFK